MTRTVRTLLASTAIAVALPAIASAHSLPSPIEVSGGNITEIQVEEGLTELGYTDITYLQGAGAYYTVRARYDGRYVPLEVNAETGEVSRLGDPDMQRIAIVEGTMDEDIEKGLHEIGYSNVTIKNKQGNVAVASADRYGETAELTIDLETGAVTNESQDDTWYVTMRDGMTGADVGADLETMGYTEVHQIRETESGWTGYAVQDGQKVEIWVDSYSGEVRSWPMGSPS